MFIPHQTYSLPPFPIKTTPNTEQRRYQGQESRITTRATARTSTWWRATTRPKAIRFRASPKDHGQIGASPRPDDNSSPRGRHAGQKRPYKRKRPRTYGCSHSRWRLLIRVSCGGRPTPPADCHGRPDILGGIDLCSKILMSIYPPYFIPPCCPGDGPHDDDLVFCRDWGVYSRKRQF